jgi:hypothetical protein
LLCFNVISIISRLTQVPIEMFDYLALKSLWQHFIIAYLIFIVMNMSERKTKWKSTIPKYSSKSLKFTFCRKRQNNIQSGLENLERWILLWYWKSANVWNGIRYFSFEFWQRIWTKYLPKWNIAHTEILISDYRDERKRKSYIWKLLECNRIMILIMIIEWLVK